MHTHAPRIRIPSLFLSLPSNSHTPAQLVKCQHSRCSALSAMIVLFLSKYNKMLKLRRQAHIRAHPRSRMSHATTRARKHTSTKMGRGGVFVHQFSQSSSSRGDVKGALRCRLDSAAFARTHIYVQILHACMGPELWQCRPDVHHGQHNDRRMDSLPQFIFPPLHVLHPQRSARFRVVVHMNIQMSET